MSLIPQIRLLRLLWLAVVLLTVMLAACSSGDSSPTLEPETAADSTPVANSSDAMNGELELEGDSVYFVYRNHANSMFPVSQRNSDLTTKYQVFGLALDGEARAYPLALFEDHVPVNDILTGQNVVIIPDSSGSGVRAYD